jgi:hypothetical protein
MAKRYLKQKAIKLREDGYSYSYIQEQTGVSKSTLCEWLSDLPYKPNQETIEKINKARLMANEAQRAKKRKSIKDAHVLAVKDIGVFNKRDLFMLGLGIYIGEGSKTNNIIRVVNSDPKIIRTMILWFKKVYGLQNINFSIRIHLYPDSNLAKATTFWIKETGLSKGVFLKAFVDNRTDKKRKDFSKLPYGTAHLSIKDAGQGKAGSFLSRRILSSIEIVHKRD